METSNDLRKTMVFLGLILLICISIYIWYSKNNYISLHADPRLASIMNYELAVKTFRQRKCPLLFSNYSKVTCKPLITDFRPYLVVPIFRNHFGDASYFFRTFIENIIDLDRIDIQVVLSDDQEVIDFIGQLQRDKISFEKMNLHFWSFGKLLQNLNITLYDGWDKFSSKLPYLSLKKLAGLSVSKKWQYALIIDCEAVIRKPTNLTEVFIDFFISPYMFYENATIHKWLTDGSRQALRIPNSVIPSEDMFVGQYHGWFLERTVFDKFIEHLLYNSTDLLHWAHSVPDFSNEHMYSFWLLWNRNGITAHYTFIDINELLKHFLSDELMKQFYPAWNTRILPQGSFECLYCWATPEIIDLLKPFFIAYKLTLYDYHTDHTSDVGDCTVIRLIDTVPTLRIQATSQASAKGTWQQMNCEKIYHGICRHVPRFMYLRQ